MHIEIDQSGKVERLNHDTYIAFSNDKQHCIKLSRKIKRGIYFNYKNKIKQLRYKLFCISVYYCIEKVLDSCELIVIDDEYHGKNNLIKSILMSYIKNLYKNFNKDKITFDKIGKNSNAHHVAIETFRGEHKPNEVLTEKQIWRFLK